MSQSLGQRIRQARKASGMTQDQLAQGVPVSRQTVSSWENDRTQPDYETLQKIAELLNIEIAQLFQAPDGKEKQEEVLKPESMPLSEPMSKEPVDVPEISPAAVETVPEAEPVVEPALEAAKSGFRLSFTKMIILAAVALVLLMGAYTVWRISPKVKAPSLEWFMSEQQPVENACYVELSTSETPVVAYSYPPGSTPRWAFRVTLLETGGVGYTIQRISQTYFYHEWFGRTVASEQDEITPWQIQQNLGSQYVGPDQVRMINLNVQGDERTAGVGLMLDVIDDHGKQQVFHIFIPFQSLDDQM